MVAPKTALRKVDETEQFIARMFPEKLPILIRLRRQENTFWFDAVLISW